MLTQGKRYRIKERKEGCFGIDKEAGLFITYERGEHFPYTHYDVAVALATDNYEEVKQKIKKTFYQAVEYEFSCGSLRSCGFWYSTRELCEEGIVWEKETYEIIEREFEVEE